MEMCREETKQDMGECARRPTYECLCKDTGNSSTPSPVARRLVRLGPSSQEITMIGVLDPRIVNESQVKDKTVAIGRAMDVMSARSLVSQARSLRQSMPRAVQAERKQPLDMSIGHSAGMHMRLKRCHSFKASTREMQVLVLCTIMLCVEKLNNGSKSPLSVELYQDLGMGSAREAEVPRYVSRQIQGLCSLGPQAGRNPKIRSLSVHV